MRLGIAAGTYKGTIYLNEIISIFFNATEKQ